MSGKSKRLAVFAVLAVLISGAVWLVLSALQNNIVLFYSPSELSEAQKTGRQLRVGGLVEEGSVHIDGLSARFDIGDGEAVVSVVYTGALPDLFREGQGIIAQGTFDGDMFTATSVLAKHDETYMPREIADSLKDKGVWQGDTTQ